MPSLRLVWLLDARDEILEELNEITDHHKKESVADRGSPHPLRHDGDSQRHASPTELANLGQALTFLHDLEAGLVFDNSVRVCRIASTHEKDTRKLHIQLSIDLEAEVPALKMPLVCGS